MFQFTTKEFEALKSQIVTSSWGGLRRALPYASTEHRDLARKIEALEKKYDEQFAEVFAAIKELVTLPEAEPPRRRIGFHQS
jgi:hypothetical protein